MDSSDDLEVTLYVQDSSQKYSDGDEWKETITWHSTTKSEEIAESFSWTSDTTFTGAGFSGGLLYVQVLNTKTGSLLDQTTFNIP